MMRWILLLCAFFAGSVHAQQIRVRSGAHEDFARLVLIVPPGTKWTTEPEANSLRLYLKEYDDGFDISRIFDRIDRTFVSKVTANDYSLTVEFSCECEANVFFEGPDMIVLDVQAASKEVIAELPNPNPFLFGQNPLRFNNGRQSQNLNFSQEQRPVLTRSSEVLQNPDQIENLRKTLIDDLAFDSDASRLQQAQTRLSEQIGAAATRGILTPSDRINLSEILPEPQIDTRIFDSSIHIQPEDDNAQSTSNSIKITNSSDAKNGTEELWKVATGLEASCIDPERVAIQKWSSQTEFSAALATLRSRLFGEFDKLDLEIAIELVKFYLYYGFGVEARQIMLMDASLTNSHPELASIAEIMEYGYSADFTYLIEFSECEGNLTLWSILSVPIINSATEVNIKASLLSLSNLPIHLRKLIAPALSKRLLTYGDKDAAAAALRSLERTLEPISPRADLAKANLEMAKGNTEEAREILSEVIESNTEQSAEALVSFVDSHLNANSEIDGDITTLIEAYALEMRDSPIGGELERAHILALGNSGHFSAAFDALSQARTQDFNLRPEALHSTLINLLTRNAPDAEFLDHVFTQLAVSPKKLASETRLLTAERLVDLGFYEQGEMVLAVVPEHPNDSKRAMLEAKIALGLSRPSEAFSHLLNETSEAADALRAQAEENIGNFTEAHSIYVAIGDEANSQHTAWLSENWPDLVEVATPVYGPIVHVSQNALDASPELEGMLQRTAAAISESQEARSAISNLLNSGHLESSQ